MTAPRGLLAAVLVPLTTMAGIGACGYDFDRYDPVDGGSETAAGDGGAEGDAAAPPGDSGGQADASCTPSTSCLGQAAGCGHACGQTYKQCTANCQGQTCAQCTPKEQSCLGQCITACLGCTQMAGCTDSPGCLDAARPGP